MSAHTCHYPPCRSACPPKHLMCGYHWSLVPRDVQQEVYRTVKLRGPGVDATWAPWWRAQAEAIRAVGEQLDPGDGCDRYYSREMEFAKKLEGK